MGSSGVPKAKKPKKTLPKAAEKPRSSSLLFSLDLNVLCLLTEAASEGENKVQGHGEIQQQRKACC
jgi:hypothetical protein